MNTLFLLIVLTQNGAGDINASFVNTQTLELCQQKAELVSAVFTASKIPILQRECAQSNLVFSSFEHASTSRLINNFYLIEFDNNVPVIKKIETWRDCMMQAKDSESDNPVYCASSVQSLE